MRKSTRNSSSELPNRMAPPITHEARNAQLIYLAECRAKEQLENGTASSQIIAHYLRLGSPEESLKTEKMQLENELIRAKIEAVKAAGDMTQIYTEALAAFRGYSGQEEILAEEYEE